MNAPFSLFTRNTEAHQSLRCYIQITYLHLGREIRIMHAGEDIAYV